MMVDYNYLKENGFILYEIISGSRLYGTNKPTSDFDKRYVYALPSEYILGMRGKYVEQVNDKTNDVVGYEIGRFLELVSVQNPNILELLFVESEENILYKHPMFDDILQYKDKFLSKVCRDSFGGYAIAQIKKARGLNKKIVNPVEKERKNVLDFCYAIVGYKSVPLKEFLENSGYQQQYCGLVAIDHARDTYALFYDDSFGRIKGYRGIMNEELTSNEIRLSSVEKGEEPVITILYNKDGYTKYCKDYKEYWEWVEKRNDDRYQTNQEHGKGYDSKNMMHCIRLTRMAIEIAEQKKVIVKRPDAEELLTIRNGDAEYNDLLNESETSIKLLDELYERSDLPEKIDPKFVNDILLNFRKKYYNL